MAAPSWPPGCSAPFPPCDICREREGRQVRYLCLAHEFDQINRELNGSKVLVVMNRVVSVTASIATSIFAPGLALGFGRRNTNQEVERNQKLQRLEKVYLEMEPLNKDICGMFCPFGGGEPAVGRYFVGPMQLAGPEQVGGGGVGRGYVTQPHQAYGKDMAAEGSGHYNPSTFSQQFDQPASGHYNANPPGGQYHSMDARDGAVSGHYNQPPPQVSKSLAAPPCLGPGSDSGQYNSGIPPSNVYNPPPNHGLGSISGHYNGCFEYDPAPNPGGFSSGQGQYTPLAPAAPSGVGRPYDQSAGTEFGPLPGADNRPGSSGSSRGMYGPPSGMAAQPYVVAPTGSSHRRNPSSGRTSAELSRGGLSGAVDDRAADGYSYENVQQQVIEPARLGSAGAHPNPHLLPTEVFAEKVGSHCSDEESDAEEEGTVEPQHQSSNAGVHYQQGEISKQQLQAGAFDGNPQYSQRGNANSPYHSQAQPIVAPPLELHSVQKEDASSSDESEEDEEEEDDSQRQASGGGGVPQPMSSTLEGQPPPRLHSSDTRVLQPQRQTYGGGGVGPQPLSSTLEGQSPPPLHTSDASVMQTQHRPMRLQDRNLQRQTGVGMPETMSSTSYDRQPVPYASDPRTVQPQRRLGAQDLPMTVQDFQEGMKFQDEKLQRQISSSRGMPQAMSSASYERQLAPAHYPDPRILQQTNRQRTVALAVSVQELQEGIRLHEGPRGSRAPPEGQWHPVGRQAGPDMRRGPYHQQAPALPVAKVLSVRAAGAPYMCDSCSRPLQAQEYRYNCNICRTLDLCSACYSRREFHHPYHKEFTELLV